MVEGGLKVALKPRDLREPDLPEFSPSSLSLPVAVKAISQASLEAIEHRKE
jgi:hypothetical protein